MSLTVEDGTGLEDAESYCSVDFMRTWLDKMGIDPTEATDEELEVALRRGTLALETLYAGLWAGFKARPTQALSWPRKGLAGPALGILPDKVPVRVQQACALAAYKEYEEPGVMAPDENPSERVKEETIGPISITYADVAESTGRGTTFTLLDGLIAGFLIGGRKGRGNYVFLKRA